MGVTVHYGDNTSQTALQFAVIDCHGVRHREFVRGGNGGDHFGYRGDFLWSDWVLDIVFAECSRWRNQHLIDVNCRGGDNHCGVESVFLMPEAADSHKGY